MADSVRVINNVTTIPVSSQDPVGAENVKQTWTGYTDATVATTIVYHKFYPIGGGLYTEYTQSWKYNAAGNLLEITEWALV